MSMNNEMTVGSLYQITVGENNYTDKYLCTHVDPVGFELRRVMKAKTKIDAIRRPEYIRIAKIGNTIPQK